MPINNPMGYFKHGKKAAKAYGSSVSDADRNIW